MSASSSSANPPTVVDLSGSRMSLRPRKTINYASKRKQQTVFHVSTVWDKKLEKELDQAQVTLSLLSHSLQGKADRAYFLVQWEGYPGKESRTWEPEEGLTNCSYAVQDFVAWREEGGSDETARKFNRPGALEGATYGGLLPCPGWFQHQTLDFGCLVDATNMALALIHNAPFLSREHSFFISHSPTPHTLHTIGSLLAHRKPRKEFLEGKGGKGFVCFDVTKKQQTLPAQKVFVATAMVRGTQSHSIAVDTRASPPLFYNPTAPAPQVWHEANLGWVRQWKEFREIKLLF